MAKLWAISLFFALFMDEYAAVKYCPRATPSPSKREPPPSCVLPIEHVLPPFTNCETETCTKVAAARLYSWHYSYKANEKVTLSVQQLVDCMDRGDQPSSLFKAFTYMKNEQIHLNETYPFTDSRGQCRLDELNFPIGFPKYRVVDFDSVKNAPVGSLKYLIDNSGPLAAGIDLNDELEDYSVDSERAFDGECRTTEGVILNHSVLIIGYKTVWSESEQEEVEAIVVLNKFRWAFTMKRIVFIVPDCCYAMTSSNPDWGFNGVGYIKTNGNLCGLNFETYYLEVNDDDDEF